MTHKTERDEALAKWQRECEGGSVPVTPMMRHAYRDGWDDALAGQSAGVAEGWKLVPIEPTVEMLEAGARHIPALHVWTGMIAAAPAPVSETTGEMTVTEALMRDLLTHGIAIHRIAPADVLAEPAPVSAPAPDREQATLCEDGGKCGIGGYCGQCEKLRAASEPEQPKQSVPAPLSEYHEDTGPVVWWTWQDGLWLGEPAWIGAPTDSDWPGYHTHWTYHPEFPLPPLAEQPSERIEQDCPHGVDDGACKQCYGEAVRGVQGAEKGVCQRCGGTGVVADGEITGAGGVEFENGPVKCVKDCPDCAASAPTLGGGAEVVSPAELRSHARTIRMKEDNQGSIDRDCAEAAEALEWAALIIEAYKPQPQAAEPKGMTGGVTVPRVLLQDLTDDVEDYSASRKFKPCEAEWRANLLARARALLSNGE